MTFDAVESALLNYLHRTITEGTESAVISQNGRKFGSPKTPRRYVRTCDVLALLKPLNAEARFVALMARFEHLGYLAYVPPRNAMERRDGFDLWTIDGSVMDAAAAASPVAENDADADELKGQPRRVWGWYQDACRADPKLSEATDREIFAAVKARHKECELSPETFTRHLRTARKHKGCSKRSPRAGRAGRSIVRPDQI